MSKAINKTRQQLEKSILKSIKDLRSGLSDRSKKNMDIVLKKSKMNKGNEEGKTVPYDQEKAKDIIEAFLKIKSKNQSKH